MEDLEGLLDRYRLHQLAAALPKYQANGANITDTIWDDGCSFDIDVSIKGFVNIFKNRSLYNVDFLMKRQYMYFAKKQLLPIPISPGCILLPIRIRRPIGDRDGAYGYVSCDQIDRVRPYVNGQWRSIVALKDIETEIPTMMNYRQLSQQWVITDSICDRYFQM